tara:strand:+ start:431 stop:784 length:354 start_codon:yes stop_codon:yes gene_type:complete
MAQYEDISIDQGADVAVEIHLINKDGSARNLTNHFINAKMKKTFNSDSDNTTVFNSIVTLPASDGIATISLSNTQTDTLKAGRYVYDVEMSYADSAGDNIVERVLEGKILVTPSVTK